MMATSLINTDFIRKHLAQAVLTVLGLSGVVLVFLPFAYDTVPATFFLDSLPPPLPPVREYLFVSPLLFWWVTPFVLLPFAISAGYLRWLLTGRLSRAEAGVGYALALIAACSLVLVELVDWLGSHDDWLPVVYFVIAFGAGARFVIQNLRTATPPAPNALVAMQVVYLPVALALISLGLDNDPQIGLYLAIVTVLVYSAQIVMAAKRSWHSLIFFVPLALVWVGLLVWVWLEG